MGIQGGRLGGLAIRMEGLCAPVLAELCSAFRFRLALWEDPEELEALAHLFDLRFLLLGYWPAEGRQVSSLTYLARLRQVEPFCEMPCVLVVREAVKESFAIEWQAPLPERTLVVGPEVEFDAVFVMRIADFLHPLAEPVLERALCDAVTLERKTDFPAHGA